MPAQLVEPLFATEVGHATMVETPTGFVVAVPAASASPTRRPTRPALDRLRRRPRAMSDDLEMTFAAALRDREQRDVNRPVFDSIAQ